MSDAADESKFSEMREAARAIFQRVLAEASIARAFTRHVECDRGVLRLREDLFDLHSYSRVLVVSLGKAGHTMAEALAGQVGASLEGIVASPTQPSAQVRGFRYFRGGHPTPNAESIHAASAMLKALEAQPASALVIFMLSGGGSSIVEKPIDDEISLDDLIATYRVLVHSGAPIAEINAVRKHLSAVKGGRLAQAAFPAQQVSLLVSDVPDNMPDALASGPTMPDSTTVEDCYRIAEKYDLPGQFPQSVRELFERRALEETPKSDDPAFHQARWWPVLSNHTAIEEATMASERAGFVVHVDNSCDDWDYDRAADYLLQRVRELRKQFSPVCLISGGEVTVKVANGGVGGRNQQFALACAAKMAGEDITVLSAGTDGVDGNSPAAGAVVDGSTVERARKQGLDAGAALEQFDAHPFFRALGDAIETGPTGNNLRDLRVLLAY
ncbi:Glycerate 2-kinase [Candidatus Sulfotelmatobacter kueseliae]|uniref:Glycerate 2-kinase n=1 Tax=Candidatus Sulfotelmatobacter kueseliae TaxID=2042962 RepID=A0A2U3KRJ5_9BACT|nr:Glycerate 2-kinase [Candidatus Sulfotelmatobacter kueseliae]